jgi:hypothetical protein
MNEMSVTHHSVSSNVWSMPNYKIGKDMEGRGRVLI